MASAPKRDVADVLRQRISSGEAKQLRKWELEAKKKSSNGGSSTKSYDGPVIKVDTTGSSTDYLATEPVRLGSVAGHPKVDQWSSCRVEARSILDEAGLEWQSLGVFIETDAAGRSRPVMWIEVEDTRLAELWRPTTISICQMLFVNDCLDLAVVISAPRPAPCYCFAISSAHHLVHTWPLRFRVPFLESLDSSTDWETVGVFEYGPSSTETTPTVVVTVPSIHEQDYVSLERRLKSRLNQLSAPFLDVKILQGQMSASNVNDLSPTDGSPRQTYTPQVPMGYSIGVEPKGSGTMGGYVRVTQPSGTTRICALTNYHVVRTCVPEWREEWDTQGIQLGQYPSNYSSVYSPSAQDHAKETEELVTSTQGVKDGINKTSLYFAGEDSSRCQLHDDRLALCRSITQTQTHFGKVIAASGYRKSGKQRLDWALILVNNDRIGENKFPKPDELPGFNLRGLTKPKEFVDDLSVLPLLEYFKIGRTTALTTGVYNGIDLNVRVELPVNHNTEQRRQERAQRDAAALKGMTKADREKAYAAPFKVQTEEHCLVAASKVRERAFGRPGDSGSWVFSDAGQLVGMIWGQNEKGATVFTPIDLIMKDIEFMTGGCKYGDPGPHISPTQTDATSTPSGTTDPFNPATPATDVNPAPTKGALDKKLPLLSIDALSLLYKRGALGISIDATVRLGPTTFSLIGFSMAIVLSTMQWNNLKGVEPVVEIRGLEIMLDSPPVSLMGVFIHDTDVTTAGDTVD
ncbi:MAG: hypothetical protein Q9210_001152 [Variospora velana]